MDRSPATAEVTQLGLVNHFEIALVKTDPELIDKIVAARTRLNPDKVKFRMRYNCWTVEQFAQLCDRAVPTITEKTLRPMLVDGKVEAHLDHCYPFPGGNVGPKFVVRNEKSMKYLLASLS